MRINDYLSIHQHTPRTKLTVVQTHHNRYMVRTCNMEVCTQGRSQQVMAIENMQLKQGSFTVNNLGDQGPNTSFIKEDKALNIVQMQEHID